MEANLYFIQRESAISIPVTFFFLFFWRTFSLNFPYLHCVSLIDTVVDIYKMIEGKKQTMFFTTKNNSDVFFIPMQTHKTRLLSLLTQRAVTMSYCLLLYTLNLLIGHLIWPKIS